ncbi:MAG: flagellar biosynthetic protein FliO [Alphaproteobacteria bacterium]|nr:flagellar biosynthetic protein FliO [Alphaproteobacteria bacterium]
MDLVNIARFVLSFVVVIGLLGGLAWILRRYGTGRITAAAGKGRLGVVEVSVVDAKRRLVLLRRDDVEHLILLSPTSETVIETGIEKTTAEPRFAERLEIAKSEVDPTAKSEPTL